MLGDEKFFRFQLSCPFCRQKRAFLNTLDATKTVFRHIVLTYYNKFFLLFTPNIELLIIELPRNVFVCSSIRNVAVDNAVGENSYFIIGFLRNRKPFQTLQPFQTFQTFRVFQTFRNLWSFLKFRNPYINKKKTSYRTKWNLPIKNICFCYCSSYPI